jgi:uncharacterized protein (TIGR03083 family)
MIEPAASPAGPLPPSEATESLTPDDVRVAARLCYETLEPVSGADWSRPAGDLEWDCRTTLEHLVFCLDIYSLLLATPSRGLPPRPRNRYPELSNDELLQIMQLRVAVLASVVAASAPTDRGFHIWGRPDPSGYIAIACTEILLHTEDIGRGLGQTWQPPEALCQRALARLCPWAPTDVDPWSAMNWATGRQSLPGYADTPANWAWHSSPLAEWDGTIKTRDSYAVR